MSHAEGLSPSPERQRLATDAWLWFGVLGGAIAWMLHLLLAYAIAEFGCVSPFHEVKRLGLSGVAWLEGLASLPMLGLAIFANIVAQRNTRLRRRGGCGAIGKD